MGTWPQGRVTMPDADRPVSFAEDIRPLFRDDDRDAMDFAFDLWNVNDVRSNAGAILERLQDGSMPCDGEWSSDEIDLFSRWIATGMPD
jgi:hypothetical protein